LIDERRGGTVNGAILVGHHRSLFIHGVAVTLKTRPMTPSPTGIEMGLPLSITS